MTRSVTAAVILGGFLSGLVTWRRRVQRGEEGGYREGRREGAERGGGRVQRGEEGGCREVGRGQIFGASTVPPEGAPPH